MRPPRRPESWSDAKTCSVPWDGRIDGERPGVDAALQVVHLAKAVLQHRLGHATAAHTVVAVEGDGRVLIELLDVVDGFLVQRAPDRNTRQVAFTLRPHVEQLQL